MLRVVYFHLHAYIATSEPRERRTKEQPEVLICLSHIRTNISALHGTGQSIAEDGADSLVFQTCKLALSFLNCCSSCYKLTDVASFFHHCCYGVDRLTVTFSSYWDTQQYHHNHMQRTISTTVIVSTGLSCIYILYHLYTIYSEKTMISKLF